MYPAHARSYAGAVLPMLMELGATAQHRRRAMSTPILRLWEGEGPGVALEGLPRVVAPARAFRGRVTAGAGL
jgi:hypothetical protein